MNSFTVRFCHLRERPRMEVGTRLNRGDAFCIMGNTGQSTGDHLHIDCIRGLEPLKWTLHDMEILVQIPDIRQLNYFIDDELFHKPFIVETWYGSFTYQNWINKVHCGYDLRPKDFDPDSIYPIYWNRSKPGIVLAIGSDPNGYGNYIHVGFEG